MIAIDGSDLTDDQIRGERQRAARAGEHDLADYCEFALGQHDATGGLTDPLGDGKLTKSEARRRIAAALREAK